MFDLIDWFLICIITSEMSLSSFPLMFGGY
eukprot:COSAG05_NODE_1141_length_5738_cov_29.493350_4_plen_29_part_01